MTDDAFTSQQQFVVAVPLFAAYDLFKTYNIGEEETRMTKFEMLEEAIEGHTIEATPRTVDILSCLRLLTTVIVVEKLIDYPCHVLRTVLLAFYGSLLL